MLRQCLPEGGVLAELLGREAVPHMGDVPEGELHG